MRFAIKTTTGRELRVYAPTLRQAILKARAAVTSRRVLCRPTSRCRSRTSRPGCKRGRRRPRGKR